MIDLNVTTVLAVVFIVLVDAWAVWYYFRRRGTPPGPVAFPVIGSLVSLGDTPHETFSAMGRTYGNICSFWLGTRLVVVLNGYETMREAFLDKAGCFSHRPSYFLPKLASGGISGDSTPRPSHWRAQQRLSSYIVRSFTLGQTVSLERKITVEIQGLFDHVTSMQSAPFDPERLLLKSVANTICSVIFDVTFPYDHQEFCGFLELFKRNTDAASKIPLGNYFPFLRHLPIGGHKECFENSEVVQVFMKKTVAEHREKFDPEKLRDFTDVYLSKVRDANDGIKFTDDLLMEAIRDIFVAGTSTAAAALQWAILYMTVYPEVQEKVQDEIDRVVGKDRLPSLIDRSNLPYTEATMMEVSRLRLTGPLSLTHVTQQDTELSGFNIPKGTVIIPNVCSVSTNPEVWKNPLEFDPAGFLDSDGRLMKEGVFLPFSSGWCASNPGEQLARMLMFLYFSCLMQQFRFQKPDGAPPPSLRPKAGLNLVPCPYEIVAIPRT
ncbi:cytochrome P450 2U1-like [Branchiostoma floridae]|uniref:Cytochrome P450 2U1-like n=1 Tax=Branchiostoma floridae TaxID=7739 RepID=A0A9J7KRP1_BRAFL|nr:cytochrome P450 2U1-like [Branchiostoma floridae]